MGNINTNLLFVILLNANLKNWNHFKRMDDTFYQKKKKCFIKIMYQILN